MSEGLADVRGLFGLIGHRRAAWYATLALEQLAHRGSRDCGLVVGDGRWLRAHRGRGAVGEVFGGHELQLLTGTVALAQTGVAVTDGLEGAQLGPHLARTRDGQLAGSLVGGLTNGVQLREGLVANGALLTSTSDVEVVLHRIAQSPQPTFVSRVLHAISGLQGGWALVLVAPGRLVASRDPRGIRPLWLGRVDGALMCCSEVGPITALGGEILREVKPGEVLVLDQDGANSVTPFLKERAAPCLAEWLWLARADGRQGDADNWSVRRALGEALASEQPCPQGQVVVGTPEAGEALAMGFAAASGLEVSRGLEAATLRQGVPLPLPELGPLQESRQRYRCVPGVVRAKRVVLVAPTLLRGHALRDAVRVLRAAGAVEVHVRLGTPAVRNECLYGVPLPATSGLAAVEREDVSALRTWVGADTLAHLSLTGLRQTLRPLAGGSFCDACASGDFPILPPRDPAEDQLTMFP